MPARHFEVEMAKPQPAARMEEGVMEDSEYPENNNNNYSTIELFVKWITTEEVEFHWLSSQVGQLVATTNALLIESLFRSEADASPPATYFPGLPGLRPTYTHVGHTPTRPGLAG